MMSEASFASLGPTLLARKGGAKPAMRPQLTPLPDDISGLAALAEEQLEDLGWNDMGADGDASSSEPVLIANKSAAKKADPLVVKDTSDQAAVVEADVSAQIVPIASHPSARVAANEDTQDHHETANLADAESPVVRSQQKRLAKRILADAASPLNAAKPGAKKSRRAAFTLRLDTDRHLKLRLAATMQGVSAQALVTQALDAFLESIAELDPLVERMKRD